MRNNKSNKWWNFFKFKFNKDQSKHEPTIEPHIDDVEDNLWNLGHTTHRRFIVPVMGKPKWWQFRKKRKYKKNHLRAKNNISMIKEYKEDIDWTSNGEMWFPENKNNNNN